jgi:hypothetical protein
MAARGISGGRLILLVVLGLLVWGSVAGAELEPAFISPAAASASRPLIATDGAGNLVAVWRELDGRDSSIRAAFRPPGGAWTSKTISPPAAATESPALAMDRLGNAVAIWHRSTGRDSVVQAAVRPAGGDWNAAEDVSTPSEPAFDADVVLEAGRVVAVWVVLRNRQTVVVSAARTIDGDWTTPEVVAGPEGDPSAPAVALDDRGGAVAAFHWWDGAHHRVAAAARSLGGRWSSPELLSIPGRRTSPPQLTMDANGNAVAGWTRSDGDWNVPQVISRSAGGVWGAPTTLSNRGGNASLSDLAMTRSGHAIAVWKQGRPSASLWSASKEPGTERWGEPAAISEDWTRLRADVALDEEGNATAVWSSFYTVSASFKPVGKPWQDDYLLSHYDARAAAPAVATYRPRFATALWSTFGTDGDRIQSVSYDINTSAEEQDGGDEDESDDEDEDEDGERVMGTALADRLVGTPGDDIFYGLGGDDTIVGRGGRDIVYGGPGNDRIAGGAGRDRLLGGPGRDVLAGGPGGDVLVGGSGRDVLVGGRGDDTLRARDRRRDRIRGGAGLDRYRLDRWLDRARSIESRLEPARD